MTLIDYRAAREAWASVPRPVRNKDGTETYGDFSIAIGEVASWLQLLGLTVEPFAHWLDDEDPEDGSSKETWAVSGRISFEKRWIGLNEPNAQRALEVLCHEAGHWFAYVHLSPRFPDDEDAPYNQQDLAYLYGWAVIRFLGLDHLISKTRWREHHADLIEDLPACG